jgi:proline racemase
VQVGNGRPRAVTIRNVPSFLQRQRAVVPVPGFGKVAADIAWGGNWFAFVEAAQLGLQVDRSQRPQLHAAALAVRQALQEQRIFGVHPERGGDEVVDHVKLFEELDTRGGPGARAYTLCPGNAYDRSPCGTGTSAKLAVLHAKGELAVGQEFRSESVLGTAFTARIVGTTQVGNQAAIVPEVTGSAWVTGLQNFVLDPEDPCVHGLPGA